MTLRFEKTANLTQRLLLACLLGLCVHCSGSKHHKVPVPGDGDHGDGDHGDGDQGDGDQGDGDHGDGDAHGDGDGGTGGDGDAGPENCTDAPPEEATRKVGTKDGVTVLPGGRTLTPAGVHAVIGGFPVDARLHPSLKLAYVANTGYTNDYRSVQVVNIETGELVQEVKRADSFYGLALSADGTRLYASGGFTSLVDVYDVDAEGKLSSHSQLSVDNYPAGLTLSKDGSKLWVGQFKGNVTSVVEFDTDTLKQTKSITVPFGAYNLLELPERKELYVAGFADDRVAVIDLTSAIPVTITTITVGGDPLGLVRSADEKTVYVTVSNGDTLVAVDTASRKVTNTRAVGEASIADAQGAPLPASSPGGLSLDASTNTLYVARAADNAISLFDAATFTPKGSIPVAWYPTSVVLSADSQTMFVTNGKGIGPGPLLDGSDNSGKGIMKGSVNIVDLDKVDLPSATAQVESNVRRPDQVFPFHCRDFPVPNAKGQKSPIEHIILVVRENKTYDAVLGDFARGEGQADLAVYGKKITPNLHALVEQFVNHDNFYDDSETSVQGHFWLTSGFTNDYMERTWFEDYRNHPNWGTDPVAKQARPSWLTFFTHLMKNNIDFNMYGEIVGTLDSYNGTVVGVAHSDAQFPGGPYFNLDTKDEDKARYVIKKIIEDGKFPPFIYLLLPRDHTKGLDANQPTPESMIAENDYATGVFVDAISHSKYWHSTAIFIVEDDPQLGQDHVDYHRSILTIASPWAKHGATSHVHTSYPSLFRTFELILGIGPMSRYDALATPLWDSFSQTADDKPFSVVARMTPDGVNPAGTPQHEFSAAMDFSRPDANPELQDLLTWGRTGVLPKHSRLNHITPAQLRAERLNEAAKADSDEDSDEEEGVTKGEFEKFLERQGSIK